MLEIILALGSAVVLFGIVALYVMDESGNKYISGLQDGVTAGITGTLYIVLVFVPIIILLVAVGLAYLELFGVDTGLPDQILPYYVQTLILSPLAFALAIITIILLDNDNGELIHAIDPETGDFAVKTIKPRIWSEVNVKEIMMDEDGRLVAKERDKSDLPTATVETKSGFTRTKMKTAYECLHYDTDSKTIYTSFLAGLSPREVRSRKNSLEYIQEVLAWESDRGSKLEANFMNITRDAVKTEVNHLIHTLEGAELPNHSLTKSIERATKDNDLEYLTDKDVADVDDEIGMENPAKEDSLLDEYRSRTSEGGDDE